MIPKSLLPFYALALLALAGPSAASLAQGGPTPFPGNDSADWLGKGVVRVFPWMTDNRNYFWSQRDQSQNAIVFVGDSLTGNWGNLAKSFPDLKVANRGIGGEVTRGTLFRFKEDVLDLNPRAIVLMIGTNDLSALESPNDALSNLSDILDMVQADAPAVPLILCTIPPRLSKEAPIDNARLLEYNQGITNLATGRKQVTLLDLYLLFLQAGTDQPDPQYFKPDKMHFGEAGYLKWKGALDEVFAQLKLK